jgi:uncharacterized protein (TIGR02466 family)
MNVSYSQVLENTIFPSFIISAKPSVSIKKIEKECYEIKSNFKNVRTSNSGSSFHSEVFGDKTDYENFSELKKLEKVISNFTETELNKKNFKVKITDCSWWVNINHFNSYNTPHMHGRSDVIGVFYVKIPNNSGNLILMRNDGSDYTNLFKNKPELKRIGIPAEIGRLYIMPGHLWHYVETNESQEDRISIAYNIKF